MDDSLERMGRYTVETAVLPDVRALSDGAPTPLMRRPCTEMADPVVLDRSSAKGSALWLSRHPVVLQPAMAIIMAANSAIAVFLTV